MIHTQSPSTSRRQEFDWRCREVAHREGLAPGGDFPEEPRGSAHPWFLGMLDVPPCQLLAAVSRTCFHASADIEGQQLGVGEEGQADPLTGRALTALPGEGGYHKSWGTPQKLWYPAETWTRQRAPLQQEGAGSSGLSGPGRLGVNKATEEQPAFTPFLQPCSMHALAGWCPGTPETLPDCSWLLSLPRQFLVILEKPFSSSSSSLCEVKLSCKLTCFPLAAGILPVWPDLLQEVSKRTVSNRPSYPPLKFNLICPVHLCKMCTSCNPE